MRESAEAVAVGATTAWLLSASFLFQFGLEEAVMTPVGYVLVFTPLNMFQSFVAGSAACGLAVAAAYYLLATRVRSGAEVSA